MSTGALLRFSFDGLPVRGALVRLTASWREALRRRATVGAFPPPVRTLLGEMAAAGMLMQSSIKFDGALVLQLESAGPLKLAVAEVSSDLSFRATARLREDSDIGPDTTLVDLTGHAGRCAITLDPRDRPAGTLPYQGIVPLSDADGIGLPCMADVLEFYMLQSEQLTTRFVLAANDELAAGLLLQRMPDAGGDDAAADEAFERIAVLGASLSREELLTLDPDTMLRRLFWAEPLRCYQTKPASFRCTCSRGRVEGMLLGLGREEIDDIVAELGTVEVGCDFCGEQYRFDAVDVGVLFAPPSDQAAASDTLQ